MHCDNVNPKFKVLGGVLLMNFQRLKICVESVSAALGGIRKANAGVPPHASVLFAQAP